VTPTAAEPRAATTDRLGLTLKPGLSFEDWQATLKHVAVIHESSAWWLGDCLAFGEHRYMTRYRFAVNELGLGYSRARDLVYVSTHVPRARRREAASWSHHRLVAKLPPDDQERWLEAAIAGRWSTAEMKAAIDRSRPQATALASARSPSDASCTDMEEVSIVITAPTEQLQRWRNMAEARSMTLGELAGEALELLDRSTRARRARDLRAGGTKWADVADEVGYRSAGEASNQVNGRGDMHRVDV
jgi:hypothetical protein